MIGRFNAACQKKEAKEEGIHKFSGLERYVLYLSMKDPLVGNGTQCSDNVISFYSDKGKQSVTVKAFGEMCVSYQPDIVASPAVSFRVKGLGGVDWLMKRMKG